MKNLQQSVPKINPFTRRPIEPPPQSPPPPRDSRFTPEADRIRGGYRFTEHLLASVRRGMSFGRMTELRARLQRRAAEFPTPFLKGAAEVAGVIGEGFDTESWPWAGFSVENVVLDLGALFAHLQTGETLDSPTDTADGLTSLGIDPDTATAGEKAAALPLLVGQWCKPFERDEFTTPIYSTAWAERTRPEHLFEHSDLSFEGCFLLHNKQLDLVGGDSNARLHPLILEELQSLRVSRAKEFESLSMSDILGRPVDGLSDIELNFALESVNGESGWRSVHVADAAGQVSLDMPKNQTMTKTPAIDDELKKDFDGRLVNGVSLIELDPPDSDPVLPGLFDRGDKVALLAPSKTHKTFFLLHVALCLASGRSCMGFDPPRPFRVLFAQFEVKPGHFHRRLHRMARAMGIDAKDVEDRLMVFNGRGLDCKKGEIMSLIHGMATGNRSEIAFLDPFYKLCDGDENSAADVKPTLAAFDRLANDTGAAVLYAHHDAKGRAGDRDIRDRGAGSGVLARDYDSGITLSPHATDPDATVIEFLCRNYLSPDRQVVRFRDYRFELATDLLPEPATSRTQRNEPVRGDLWCAHLPNAIDLALSKVWLKGNFDAELTNFNLSNIQRKQLFKAVRDDPRVYAAQAPNRGTVPQHLLGLEADVKAEIERRIAEKKRN